MKLKWTRLPSGVTKTHLYGASVLGGIGFTMSIFVSSLLFTDEGTLSMAKISIIIASIISAIVGAIILKFIEVKVNNGNFTVSAVYGIIILKNYFWRKIYGLRPRTDEYYITINFNSHFNYG